MFEFFGEKKGNHQGYTFRSPYNPLQNSNKPYLKLKPRLFKKNYRNEKLTARDPRGPPEKQVEQHVTPAPETLNPRLDPQGGRRKNLETITVEKSGDGGGERSTEQHPQA